jgi:hypothetical protein
MQLSFRRVSEVATASAMHIAAAATKGIPFANVELPILCGGQIRYSGAMAADLRDVNPAELRLPSSRSSGADPVKLQRQIAKHGTATAGMPPLLAYEGADGALELYDGVTRATRVAKLLPGTMVQVEVIRKLKQPKGHHRRIGDTI